MMMKKTVTSVVLLLLCLITLAQTSPVKVACVGNSITFGAGIQNRDRDSYPSMLGQMLGKEYEVRNYGFSARTMLKKGDYPYMHEQMYKDVLSYEPNIVIIKLGTNDSKAYNWKYGKELKRDMETMVTSFLKLPSKPKVYLCYPPKAYLTGSSINDSIIVNGIIPVIDKVAHKYDLQTIDLHTATSGMQQHFPDKVHPNPVGAAVIAETTYQALTSETKKYDKQAFPGLKTQWEGFDRYDFDYKNRQVIVVTPGTALKGNPWIWRPAFFGAFPSVDKALLEKGFHVAYYDLTHLYGSPNSMRLGDDFYKYMTSNYALSSKVTLEGFSRGGLCALNWAARNTDKVACIYVDAPVCDVFSWPGRKNKELWDGVLKEWQLTDKEMASFKGNPIDVAHIIAKAGIPVISVCGDSDKVVPFEENMKVVRDILAKNGSQVELIVKAGVDHHPHSLENPKPVVDFIVRNQPDYQAKQYINKRGSMKNSFIKFERERKGRVVFLGGSITRMEGWVDLIEEQLKKRFPYTEFDFINAGIPSTGSTPGAFRFKNDALKNGDVDLLFVEAAVNDDTNGFDYVEQVRGMEGEVRQALIANPNTDIVMLHFIYDPFIPIVKEGRTPDVVMNHERVANHYLIPSVNLIQEIAERMEDGEFTWNQFGGTHPAPLGHDYYAASIARLFDSMWKDIDADEKIIPHNIPEKPLDEYSYFNGELLSINNAKLSGWNYVNSWTSNDKIEKRSGFFNVPMLEAKAPGAKLSFKFDGKAIGIFCTCGPSSGIIEYSIDGAPFKKLDTFTGWSSGVYLPWVYMFATELNPGKHELMLRMTGNKNRNSKGYELQIRDFVTN